MNGCCGPIQTITVFGPPTLGGYSDFLYNYIQIPTDALPTNSFSITVSYALAVDIVSRWLCAAGVDIFTLAVYDLAVDRLFQFANDNPSAPPPDNTYFADKRQAFGISQFRAGVVQSAHDVSTGTSLVVPDWAKNLTILDLQAMNTPWGREALGLMQQIGSLWGLS